MHQANDDDGAEQSLLVQVSDRGLGRKFPLRPGCVIGRSQDTDIQLVDGLVSKRHARISLEDGAFVIEDLGSRNGVTINGAAIAGKVKLAANDLIGIGDSAFLFAPDLEVLPVEDGEQAVVLVNDGALSQTALTAPGDSDPEAATAHGAPAATLVAQLLAMGASSDAALTDALLALKPGLPFTAAGVLRSLGGDFQPACLVSGARTVSLPRSLLAAVVAKRQAICVPDAAADAALAARDSARGLCALLAAPLVLGEQLLGVVFLHDDAPRAYDASHLAALLAASPALALLLALSDRQRTLGQSLARLETLQRAPEAPRIVGDSAAWQTIKAQIGKIGRAPSTVLIQGESGTGKELVAQALHRERFPDGAPFVAINCGAIPEQLMESELFGYEKGAFTGAARRTLGKLELATAGTLFLDEIGDLPLPLQVKLLRALQERQFYRLGGAVPIHIDCRLVAATHRDLRQMAAAGTFREDLFYRIAVIDLQLPPLRAHAEDIPALAAHFTTLLCRELHVPEKPLTPEALSALCRYPWPGNARELKNVLERALVLSEEEALGVGDLPTEIIAGQPGIDSSSAGASLEQHLQALERRLLERALRAARGKKVAAARALGISRPTLDKKIKDYAIDLFAADSDSPDASDEEPA